MKVMTYMQHFAFAASSVIYPNARQTFCEDVIFNATAGRACVTHTGAFNKWIPNCATQMGPAVMILERYYQLN